MEGTEIKNIDSSSRNNILFGPETQERSNVSANERNSCQFRTTSGLEKPTQPYYSREKNSGSKMVSNETSLLFPLCILAHIRTFE